MQPVSALTPIVVPIFGMLIPIVLVPVILGLKHARLEREMEHAERMRALELGRTFPLDDSWWTPMRVSVAIAVWIPVGVFFCAWMAGTSVGYHEEIWMASALVGVTGVVCGSVLAGKNFAHRNRVDDSNAAKPPLTDADAFDVVGRRG